jgi:hypoxanthine phosphoribosyltransferase
MERDMEQILFTEEQLSACVDRLAEEINRDYAGKAPLVVGILQGSFVFLADLVRKIKLPINLEFMSVSSYGSGTSSTGEVNIRLDLSEEIEGRDVILIEDILDSGNTLSRLLPTLQARGPASLKLCCLLDKPSRREREVPIDYLGFTIPDAFVVGYGLDYDQKYRNLPYIGILKPSVYSK